MFAGAGTNPGEKTLEDKFFEKEVCTLTRACPLTHHNSLPGGCSLSRWDKCSKLYVVATLPSFPAFMTFPYSKMHNLYFVVRYPLISGNW